MDNTTKELAQQRLPTEIWAQIFDLVADDDIILRPGIPTSLTESAWRNMYQGSDPVFEWKLTSPE